jgi:hypothetical protein
MADDTADDDSPLARVLATAALVDALLLLLPLRERVRCLRVCRAWREAFGRSACWLDLSLASAAWSVDDAARLRGVAALARGQLRTLDLRGWKLSLSGEPLLWTAVTDVMAANAATLTRLDVGACDGSAEVPLWLDVACLLGGASARMHLYFHGAAHVSVGVGTAALLLDPRLHTSHVCYGARGAATSAAEVAAFVDALCARPPLRSLSVSDTGTLLSAALLARALAPGAGQTGGSLVRLSLHECKLARDAVGPLAALVRGAGTLRALSLFGNVRDTHPLFDVAAADELGTALAGSAIE